MRILDEVNCWVRPENRGDAKVLVVDDHMAQFTRGCLAMGFTAANITLVNKHRALVGLPAGIDLRLNTLAEVALAQSRELYDVILMDVCNHLATS